MMIAIGSDHAGYHLKETVRQHLADAGHEVLDLGCDSPERVDYPRFGDAVARAVVEGRAERGVAICGSGVGISMAANKVPGARAACVSEPYSAMMARRHNDAHVLCFGARVVGVDVATMLVDVFLATEFEGGRHAQRVSLIGDLAGESVPGC